MFYLAFENSIEVGYVTEKLFDGLIAGTVPVFLGSAEDAKKLIPHPKSVIFLEDFKNDAWGMFDLLSFFYITPIISFVINVFVIIIIIIIIIIVI